MMKEMYSMRSPAVKRLMKEAQELREPTELYFTHPLEDNLFEWHFTIRGPENSDFDGGIYHGRIVLPPEYPMKPPNVILLTPNGRFETNKKICLSISGHHPESWQPSWSIRTALLAIIGFMPTHGGGAIGSLDYTPEERKKLAKRSVDWKCEQCGCLSMILKPLTEASKAANEEAKELASQINFRGEKSPSESKPSPDDSTASSPSSTPITTPPNTPVNQTFPNMSAFPGQFPFPAFPFPPQFNTMATPPQQQGSNPVPRFPYPPQFLPSMFPHLPMGNPFMANTPNPGLTNNQSSDSTQAVHNQPTTSTNSHPSAVSNTQNTKSKQDSNETREENNQVQESNSSPSQTMVSEEETVPAQNESSSPESELRQRNTRSTPLNFHERQQFLQYAELEPEPRQTGIRLSTVVILVLFIGILLLAFRRMYLQRVWRLPF